MTGDSDGVVDDSEDDKDNSGQNYYNEGEKEFPVIGLLIYENISSH